jgi:Flp pilus assembly protein TadD
MEVARWRPLIIEKLPFLALVAASCVVTVIAQERGGAVHTLADTSLTQRLGNAVVSYARYVIKTVWPADMAVPYPHPGHWPVGVILMSGLLLAGITAAVILARRRCPAAGFGWLWFLGTLVPVIGLVQVGSQSMADRYFYVPGIGLLIAAVWGVGHCVAGLESRWTRGAVRLLTLGVVAGLGWRTSAQIRVWRDTETLFQHAVRVTEGNYIAHYSLGHFYQSKGRRAEALEHYLRTTELKPQHPDAWNNLGVLKTEELRFNEALPYFWNALKHKPQDGEFRTNVYRCAVIAGKELAKSGDLAGATPLFRSAVELMPEAFDARNALGSALGMSGDTVGAVEQFRAALKARPDSVTAHQNLGRALMNLGQTEEGEAHLKRAAALMERPGT